MSAASSRIMPRFDPLQAAEITQNVMLGASSVRSADAHPAPHEVGPATVLDNRAEPVVAGHAAADLEPYDAEVEIEVVVHAQNPPERHLEEPHRRLNVPRSGSCRSWV